MKIEIDGKKCTKCDVYKNLDEFNKNPSNKTHGRRTVCRICSRLYSKKVTNPKPGSHDYDLVGIRFNKLVVQSLSGLDKRKNKLWLCRCDCGNFCESITTHLNKGRKSSCGCSRYKRGSELYNYTGYKDISGSRWSSIEYGAKIRNIEFNITKEGVWDILQKQDNRCYFSGVEVSFKDSSASVDRLYSSIGYNYDNIVIVHKDINKMKNNLDPEYFKKLCELVSNNK